MIDKRLNYGWGGVAVVLLSLPWIVVVIGIFTAIAGVVLAIVGFTARTERRLKCRACGAEFAVSERTGQLP